MTLVEGVSTDALPRQARSGRVPDFGRNEREANGAFPLDAEPCSVALEEDAGGDRGARFGVVLMRIRELAECARRFLLPQSALSSGVRQ
jgi:hypothetical protein